MKVYDLDLRRRIVEMVEEGISTAETAARFKVSPASVKRYVKQMRETGTLKPKVRPGHRARLGVEALWLLKEQMHQDSDLMLAEHGERLEHVVGELHKAHRPAAEWVGERYRERLWRFTCLCDRYFRLL